MKYPSVGFALAEFLYHISFLGHLHSDVHGENVNRLGPLMDLSDAGGSGGESDAPDWVVVRNASELDNVQLAEHSPDNTSESRCEYTCLYCCLDTSL